MEEFDAEEEEIIQARTCMDHIERRYKKKNDKGEGQSGKQKVKGKFLKEEKENKKKGMGMTQIKDSITENCGLNE